jgi:hypothetical protein
MWLLAKGTLLGLVLYLVSPLERKDVCFLSTDMLATRKVLNELIHTSLKKAVFYTHETNHYVTFFSLPSKLTR